MLAAIISALGFGASSFVLTDKKVRIGLSLFAVLLTPLIFWQSPVAAFVFCLFLAVLWGLPLFAVYGVAALGCFVFLSETGNLELSIFPEKIRDLADKNELLAIPFFVFAGAIMSEGGIAKRLVNVARALTDWVPGGMGVAAVAACVFFAAISGSSPVTVIAVGGMMFPAMVKADFGERASIGLLTSAGSLGIVIPPSIPMILYAISVSGYDPIRVGDLFLAGLGPGLFIGGLLATYIVVRGIIREKPEAKVLWMFVLRLAAIIAVIAGSATLGALVFGWSPWIGAFASVVILAFFKAPSEIWEGAWALALPVLILGGIYGQLFTPTDSAAVAVVYAIVVSLFVYKDLKYHQIPKVLIDSIIMIGALVSVMMLTFVLNEYFNAEQVPDRLVEWIQSKNLGPTGFLLALNILLLIVGCFMDIISAILIVAPLVVPMALAPGINIDPYHLGIIFIVNLELGYLTPPLGLNLFVASSLFKKPIEEIIRSVIPYAAILLIGVLVITYQPSISIGILAKPDIGASKPEPDGAKNLEDLMNENLGEETGNGKVKSLDEIMKETLDGDDSETDATAPAKVKSLEEIMQETLGDDSETGDTAPARVKSLEEIMNETLDDESKESDQAPPAGVHFYGP